MGVSDGHDLGASLVGVPGTSVKSNNIALIFECSMYLAMLHSTEQLHGMSHVYDTK